MSSVDISLLVPPDVVEPLDFEATLAELKADLIERFPDCAEVLDLESEPLTYLLETIAYSKVNDRSRINDAARAVMLAYATGADLDHIGANYDTPRLSGESDARFRNRIQQAYHRLAAAGPAAAYKQHAMSVSSDVIDVDVFSESPGQVAVCVLARKQAAVEDLTAAQRSTGISLFGAPEGGGAYAVAESDSLILRAVLATLNGESVRPLTDSVVVRSPEILTFGVNAVIEVLQGPDPQLIKTRREASVRAHLSSIQRIGYDVTRAGLIAALVEPGVKNVRLTDPAIDMICGHGQMAACTSISIAVEVVDA